MRRKKKNIWKKNREESEEECEREKHRKKNCLKKFYRRRETEKKIYLYDCNYLNSSRAR